MPTTIGPHLLGRVPSPHDPRDAEHMAARRIAHVVANVPAPDAALLDLTVRQAVDRGYFSTWAGVREFWRWLKTWLKHPDPTPAPVPPAPTLRRQRWNVAHLLDQGDTGHCTAFGSAHWGIADPVNSVWTADEAHAFYYREKEVDGEPGEENGSTVRTAGKVLRERGRVDEYVWVARVDEVGDHQTATLTDWLLHEGPVILGIDWYEGMFEPDGKGIIWPTGDYAGGHCLIACGVDLDAVWQTSRGRSGTGLVEIANSWGTGWGIGGHAYLTLEILQDLLDAQGEAMAGLELPLAAA